MLELRKKKRREDILGNMFNLNIFALFLICLILKKYEASKPTDSKDTATSKINLNEFRTTALKDPDDGLDDPSLDEPNHDNRKPNMYHPKPENKVPEQCKEEPVEIQMKNKRESFRKDASNLEFVSWDSLPVDEKDIHASNCRIAKREKKLEKEYKNSTIANKSVNNATSADLRRKNSEEYLFSSVEYYDEEANFDVSQCPDAVEEIILELDNIRSYDIVCESLVEWRSLE